MIEVSETLSRWFPTGGAFKGGGGVTFGDTVRIGGRWYTDDGVAFTATLPDIYVGTLYWRAATYDRFDLGGWSQTDYRDVVVAGARRAHRTPDPTGADARGQGNGVHPDLSRAFVLSPARRWRSKPGHRALFATTAGSRLIDGGGRARLTDRRCGTADNTDVIRRQPSRPPRDYPADIGPILDRGTAPSALAAELQEASARRRRGTMGPATAMEAYLPTRQIRLRLE